MKKTASLLGALLVLAACNKTAKDQYRVHITMDGMENGQKVYLQKPLADGQPQILDTLEIQEGKLEFEGISTAPELHFLFFEGVRGALPIILEEGQIDVIAYKDSLNFSKLSGTPSNEDFTLFMQNSRAIRKKVGDIQAKAMEARQKGDTVTMNVLGETFMEVQKEARNFESDFVKNNPESYMSLILLQQMLATKSAPVEEITPMFEKMPERLKQTTIGKELSEGLERLNKLAVGAIAPDFNGPTPDGNTISLKESLGKVTILDFWAAWCKPCRAENPNLVALYAKYKDKGLSVMGVSLDRTQEDWTRAIAEDQLPWNHVSNLKFWQDPIAELYDIKAIPATFILDAEGRIIAKDLRGEELEQKVAEVLGE